MLAAAFPAAAQPRQPPAPTPWSVESPGPLGARFGLGVDLALDRLDNVEVVAGIQTVTTIAADGSRQTTIAPVDVGLTNRKHGQGWEERSFGFQAPLALPPFHLGALRVEPSLVLEAAAVGGELTFVDRVEGGPDRTLDGTAARWGVGVEALGELCRGCRWFWSAGYRYRSLGGLDLGGDTQRDPGGPTVTQSVEIDHDSHHLTARLGALIAGGRATVYAGVRDRRSELVVSDETTVTSPEGGPGGITVTSRLDLEADDTVALAGTDFRLGRGYFGRVEATFGEDGESVLLKAVRLQGWTKPRAMTLAEQIKPQVAELRHHIERRVRQMEAAAGPDGAFPLAQSLALLDEIERELRVILSAPELQPTLAWFLVAIDQARDELATPQHGDRGPSSADRLALRFAALTPQPSQPSIPPPPSSQARWWVRILEGLEKLETGDLKVRLCVGSEPASVHVWLRAPYADSRERGHVSGKWYSVFRGLYAYRAKLKGVSDAVCLNEINNPCALEIWDEDQSLLICDFEDEPPSCRIDPVDATSCTVR